MLLAPSRCGRLRAGADEHQLPRRNEQVALESCSGITQLGDTTPHASLDGVWIRGLHVPTVGSRPRTANAFETEQPSLRGRVVRQIDRAIGVEVEEDRRQTGCRRHRGSSWMVSQLYEPLRRHLNSPRFRPASAAPSLRADAGLRIIQARASTPACSMVVNMSTLSKQELNWYGSVEVGAGE